MLTIVGVMPASVRFPDAHTVFWEPLDVGRRAASGDPGEHRVSVLARLGRDVTFEQADARAAALAPQWNPEWFSTGYTTRLRSLNQLAGLGVGGQFAWVQQRRAALFLLFGLAACVLLIACANAANLFLSQALSRAGMWRQPRFVLVRTAQGADPIGLLKEQVWRLDPALPVTVHAMDDVVAATLAQPRFLTTLLAAFALLAMLLAGAGLYSVVAYETSARTQEIGVRIALGATRGTVVRHVLGRSLLHSAAGTALGLLGALALSRLLTPLLYGTEPTDPPTFAVAAAFLLAAATGGAWLPAQRAARTDPMEALRAE